VRGLYLKIFTMGKVYLVGAGPGDPGLLTMRAYELLGIADVVIYDALVSPEILALIPEQTEKINAGKRMGRHSLLQTDTTKLLITKAHEVETVVRLKGGDPFMFGRGGEELGDLLTAGIETTVVPGVTAGIAAPAYAGIPLTHRDYSSSVIFVTGHESAGKYRPAVNWEAIAKSAETIVVYMGIHNLPYIIDRLLQAGLNNTTPIAIIRWGTTTAQQELIGTLSSINGQVQEAGFSAPAIIVIGESVGFREKYQIAGSGF
jgi:uroporphyrin-III C-methyltransferase